jgi:hypothetical protein
MSLPLEELGLPDSCRSLWLLMRTGIFSWNRVERDRKRAAVLRKVAGVTDVSL